MIDDRCSNGATVARFIAVVAALAGLCTVGALTVIATQRSHASAKTTAGRGSALLTTDEGAIRNGALTLTDDDDASALFRSFEMLPGHPVEACTTLTYAGSITPSGVRLHASSSGDLAEYLDVTVEVGVGGSFGDCAGFAPIAMIYAGTLDDLSSTHSTWASGLATFTAASTPTSRTVRFVVDVQSNPSAQGLTTSADFTWGTRRTSEHPTVLLDARRDQIPESNRNRHGFQL